jgi:hypothetical protein
MADLTPQEKRMFERVLEMGSGYVLNFSNRSFDELVHDSKPPGHLRHEIQLQQRLKANRLRGFWNEESNAVVAKLLGDLLDYMVESGSRPETDPQLAACRRAVARLQQSGPVPEIEVALLPGAAGQDFDALTAQVREAIEKNQPEAGLDRLHTYVVRHVRSLYAERGR